MNEKVKRFTTASYDVVYSVSFQRPRWESSPETPTFVNTEQGTVSEPFVSGT